MVMKNMYNNPAANKKKQKKKPWAFISDLGQR